MHFLVTAFNTFSSIFNVARESSCALNFLLLKFTTMFRNFINSLCGKLLEEKKNKLVSFFEQIDLFENFTPHELLTFTENLAISKREYSTNELVFEEGQTGVSMYFVYDGRIGVYKNYGKPDEVKLAELHKGSVFGEISMLRETPRTATIAALEPSILLAISQKDIEEFMTIHPSVAFKLIKNFASKLSLDLEHCNKNMESFKHRLNETIEEIEELSDDLKKCKERLKKYKATKPEEEQPL